jgi:hypothetical protein
MRRHPRADKAHTDSSAKQALNPEDEKAAQLAAALAKLKDPPAPAALIGSAVKAGESPHTAEQRAEPRTATPQDASKDAGDVDILEKTQQVAAPLLKKAAAITEAVKEQLTQDGPLEAKDLLKLGEVIKRKEQPAPEPAIKTQTIAPTNPDPEAAIVTQIAEKQRVADAEVAAAEAKKWHVEKADIHEAKLNKAKMYKLTAYWLGAIPAAFILYALIRLTLGSHVRGVVGVIIMAPMYIMGLYGLFGWIPLMLEYLKTQKR